MTSIVADYVGGDPTIRHRIREGQLVLSPDGSVTFEEVTFANMAQATTAHLTVTRDEIRAVRAEGRRGLVIVTGRAGREESLTFNARGPAEAAHFAAVVRARHDGGQGPEAQVPAPASAASLGQRVEQGLSALAVLSSLVGVALAIAFIIWLFASG